MNDEDGDYVTDTPITRALEDRFSRAPFAERIARTIIAQRDPASLVVGVYGPWGDGKTSVLNLIAQTLEADERIVPVRFNPWRLGSESEMFVGFFETLAAAVDAKLRTGAERVGQALKSYGALLKPIPLTGGVVGDAATAVGGALSETSLSKARARIEQLLAQSGKRVVILMDDIDRLDKSEVQAMFRLVKVAADFQHTAYVLAFDDSVVADALAERYAEGTGHGSSFMEKIIQLPLHLPPVAPQALLQMTLETVVLALEQTGIEMSSEDAGAFRSAFDRAVFPRIKTPRMGKRYGNVILFALPMIGSEVRVVDLLLIEAMRVFYPSLYEWVRTHQDDVIGREHTPGPQANAVHAALRAAVEAATVKMSPEEKRGAQLLLTTLFPRTESAWENKGWGSEWDEIWAKAKRVTSRQYFRRYFVYTVPPGDIRDADMDTLLTMLDNPDQDVEDIAQLAGTILASGGPEVFVQKISPHVDTMSPRAAVQLILVLSAFSGHLPEDSGFLGLSILERAGLLASKLLERVAPDDRMDAVATVMTSSERLSFAIELLRWVRPQDGEVKTLSMEETAQAGRLLVDRIIPVWEGTDPFGVLGKSAAASLHVWATYGDRAALRTCLSRRIAADLSDAFRLMGAFLGQSWSMETGVPLVPEFRREAYNALAEYADTDQIFALLRERFGEAVGTGDFYRFREMPPQERLANEFAFIHRVVLGEQAAGAADGSQG